MKTAVVVSLALGLACASEAQTVYSIPADSRGNQLTLTIANESSARPAEGLQVRVARHRSSVSFASTSQAIKTVGASKEAAVTFTFDVGRETLLDRNDTLQLIVTDKGGASWTKDVIVRYTGPGVFKLDQNFPNPFNPSTKIYYQLPRQSRVSLRVYDLLGREVATLVDEMQEAGFRETKFDASRAATGAYFCRMTARPAAPGGETFSAVIKMMVMK